MNLKLFTTPTSRVNVMLQRYEAQIKHHFIMNNCLFIIVIAFNYIINIIIVIIIIIIIIIKVNLLFERKEDKSSLWA